MVSEKTFILGERRSVMLNISTNSMEKPDNPTWELEYRDTVRTEATGDCELVLDSESGIYTMSALVQPKQKGFYRLYFAFGIGQELRRPFMVIKVI